MSRGNIQTNLDNKLTSVERSEAERVEREEARVDKLVKDTPALKHHGLLNPHKDSKGVSNATIHMDQLKYDARSVRERRNAMAPVIPAFYVPDPDTGEVTWVLNDADAEACEQGYICPQCLSWQASTIEMECRNPKGFSCGYVGGI